MKKVLLVMVAAAAVGGAVMVKYLYDKHVRDAEDVTLHPVLPEDSEEETKPANEGCECEKSTCTCEPEACACTPSQCACENVNACEVKLDESVETIEVKETPKPRAKRKHKDVA